MPTIDFPQEGYQTMLAIISDVVIIEQSTGDDPSQKTIHLLAQRSRKNLEKLADMLESDT